MGTSYSGGTGGGGCASRTSDTSVDTATSGASYGGAGGNGNSWSGAGKAANYSAGGGAGNPGGYNMTGKNSMKTRAETGTGGLLIIYAKTLENVGEISSKGSEGGFYKTGDGPNIGGGSSGGGSINIFFEELKARGNIIAEGGDNVKNVDGKGEAAGAGGNGCITIGNISTGTFEIYNE